MAEASLAKKMKLTPGERAAVINAPPNYVQELKYDQESAKPHVTAVARGWYEFKKAYAEVNKKIKARLQ